MKLCYPAVLLVQLRKSTQNLRIAAVRAGIKMSDRSRQEANQYAAVFVCKHYCEMNQNAIYR
jgi:hypothetical protein